MTTSPETSTTRSRREVDVELPVGFLDDDGRLHKNATLRKMTGHEEAILADRKLRKNGGKLVSELLTGCVRRLGEVDRISRPVVAKLCSPDRNFLLLKLRTITFGDQLEASYTCPHCGETTPITEDLDALPVRRTNGDGPGEIVVELEDGYEDNDGSFYTSMVFRLPTGSDEEKVASISRENASQGMNALLTRCLVGLGDMPEPRRQALGTKVLADLTMGDRARIDRAFRGGMPGVDLLREVECSSCMRTFKASLDFTSFFSLQ